MEYEIVETGQRLNGVELNCQLFFGVWAYGEYLYRLLWAGFE